MSTEREKIVLERAELRRKYGALFDEISAALFEADPMGINFVNNTDEYDPEVGTIIPRLAQANTAKDVEVIIHEEFCQWFGLDKSTPKEHLQPVAEKIWDVWQAFSSRIA